MPAVARSMRFTAKPGEAGALCDLLVRVATALEGTPGCEHYVVSRAPGAPDEVWVQELWASAEAADAAQAAAAGGGDMPSPTEVMALVDGRPQRVDLEPVGGVGLPATG